MKHAKLIFNLVALFINVKYWTDGYLPVSHSKNILQTTPMVKYGTQINEPVLKRTI